MNQVKTTMKKNEKFFLDIMEFYEKFLSNTSEAIRKLSEIQEKNKKEYKEFKELPSDPQAIIEKIEKLDENTRGIFLEMFIKTQSFQRRLVNLFDLSPKEQRKLADDLDKFTEYMKKKLMEIGG